MWAPYGNILQGKESPPDGVDAHQSTAPIGPPGRGLETEPDKTDTRQRHPSVLIALKYLGIVLSLHQNSTDTRDDTPGHDLAEQPRDQRQSSLLKQRQIWFVRRQCSSFLFELLIRVSIRAHCPWLYRVQEDSASSRSPDNDTLAPIERFI